MITNVIAIPFIPAQYQIALMAFVMCLLTTFLIAAISSVKRISIEGVMLFGIAVMFTYDSLLTMMQYVASETQLQTLVFWQMGSLDRGSWGKDYCTCDRITDCIIDHDERCLAIIDTKNWS